MKIFAISRLPRRLAALGILSALAASVLVPAAALAAPAQAGACGGDVKCILAFGDARIAERQAALTKLGTKIGDQLSKGHITSAQAAPLQAQVTQSQGDMTAIKTKLDAETTAAAARQDVHDIYWKYRIFAVVIPKTTRKAFYDVTTNVDAKLKGLEPKIEDAISKAPAGEKAQLNQLYSDYKAQLSEAESQLDAALGQFDTLTVSNYNTARATFETALTDLRNDENTAHTGLRKAAGDLHQIRQILAGSKGGASATPSATASS
jgi:hypothetical protein